MGFLTSPSFLCNYVNLVMSPLKTITQSDPVGLLVSFTGLAIELDDDDDDNECGVRICLDLGLVYCTYI